MKTATPSDCGDLYECWGARVRAARQQCRWTQDVMAAIVGVTRPHLANIEAGRRPPTDEVKARICGATRRSFDDLFPWPSSVPPFPNPHLAAATSGASS